jgi:ABC-type uncharacterized transport system ATPase subunit
MALIAGTLMTVDGIGKTFGTQQVLGDVSFEIGSREILGPCISMIIVSR